MAKQIILSQKLIKALTSFGTDKIANILIKLHTDGENLDIKWSYIDSLDDDTLWSYLPILKEKGLEEDEKWKSKSRTSVKIGRVVRAILQSKNLDFSDAEIETFVNQYKCYMNGGNFVLVKGSDITKYYNHKTYDENGPQNSSLWQSCMRHENTQSFFTIYEKHPKVSLLVLLNKKGRVEGRSIIWDDINVCGETAMYMDRIYSINDTVTEKFKKYAAKKKWWHKINQGNERHEITNGEKKVDRPVIFAEIMSNIQWYKINKPYMDTMRFVKFKRNNNKIIPILTNENSDHRESWASTNGGLGTNTPIDKRADKQYSLSQYLQIDINDLTFLKDNIFKFGECEYFVAEKGQIITMIFERIKIDPTIIKSFNFQKCLNRSIYETFNTSLLLKYVKDNFSKVKINSEKDTNNMFNEFMKGMSRDSIVELLKEIVADDYKNLSPCFHVNGNSTMGEYVMSFDYDTWRDLDTDNEKNRNIIINSYDYNDLIKVDVINALSKYIIASEKYKAKFDLREMITIKNVSSLLKTNSIMIDIVDYLINAEERPFEKIMDAVQPYFHVDTFIAENNLGKTLAVDGKEERVLNHTIFRIK